MIVLTPRYRFLASLLGRCVVLLAVLCVTPVGSWAQNEGRAAGAVGSAPWEHYLDALSYEEDFEDATWEAYSDLLEELADNPININTATREELERLPFLTAQQVEDLLFYRYRYGALQSRGELAMIESMGWNQQRLLDYFAYLGPAEKPKPLPLDSLLKRGHHEVLVAARIPLYERHGDVDGYLGGPVRHGFRYTFKSMGKLKLGLSGAQDAGEPFFKDRNGTGYDFYSYFLELSNMGRLQRFVVGNYKLRVGMGLVLNTDFNLGKLATLTSLARRSSGLRGYIGRSTSAYLKGAAATVELGRDFTLTAFASYRSIDATLTPDSAGIRTIQTSSYHRTTTEMARKSNAHEWLTGAHVAWQHEGFHAGLTAMTNGLDKPLQPNTAQLYRQYRPNGKMFANFSADYGYTNGRLNISGETALDRHGAVATVHSASYLLTSDLSLVALHRFYSMHYQALHAMSFAEGSEVRNENGAYVGFNWVTPWRVTFMGYADYAYFAWPTYQASRSSRALDFLLQAQYASPHSTLLVRYRFKNRQKDDAQHDALIGDACHRMRAAYIYSAYHWSLKTQIYACADSYKQNSFGWMAHESASTQWRMLKGTTSVGYFQTKDYASRLYVYEPGMRYDFNFPSFYGRGFRAAFGLEASVGSHLLLLAKIGETHYFDRDHISSGRQQIDGRNKADVDVQVRWKW